MLRSHSSSQKVAHSSSDLQLLEELDEYTMPGQFLHTCSSEELESLARNLYRAFASQEAVTMSMHRSPDVASTFFSTHAPSSPYNFAVPPDLGPGGNLDGDDGVAFEPAHAPSSPNATTLPSTPPDARNTNVHTGDELLYNNVTLLRDGLEYLEFQESIHEGDPGRTFEVIKVCFYASYVSNAAHIPT